MFNYSRWTLPLAILVVIVAGLWMLLTYFEGEKPSIQLGQEIAFIGMRTDLTLTCSDARQGLRTIQARLVQQGRNYPVADVAFPKRGVHNATSVITIDPGALKLKEGKADLEITAIDYSLRKNLATLSLPVTIDRTPPRIFPVSSSHYINPGGSCLTVYRLSESVAENGVLVNETFFPAYKVSEDESPLFAVLFALPPHQPEKTIKIGIFARDFAGNEMFSSIPHHIRVKKFRKDTMRIGKSFLENKMPEFRHLCPALKDDASLLDLFVYVNETLRKKNLEEVIGICARSRSQQLWKEPFLRMSNAATMATFGDKRIYVFEGKKISSSTHLGIDLASTVNATIEASNSGIVVYCGNIGIYGNTVIIDHGLGLFSFYAHLSLVSVEKGVSVTRGQPIGKSGTSGLAGGDHLHFGIFVGKSFVNPQEWWDPHWIEDNITKKIDLAP